MELRSLEWSVCMKEVNNQNLWIFGLSSQESMNVLIWIIVGFQQRDRQNSRDSGNDCFCWLPVTSAQCTIGAKKNSDGSILSNYNDDECSQSYAQIKEVFRTLTKHDILQTHINDEDFRSSNTGLLAVGYSFHVFDICHQQYFTACQPNIVKFKLDGVVPIDGSGSALVLTNELVSISSDGQRYFDLI